MKRLFGMTGLFSAAALLLTACGGDYTSLSSLAPTKKNFVATLVGTNEVPPVTTTAAGKMTLIQEDTINILYTLETTSATDSVTMAHIHAGAAGANGPIMVWLFPSNAPTARTPGNGGGTAARVAGVLSTARLTRAGTSFVAPFTWDSLVTRMNAGTAYVNVHTRRNGGGEIRGQIAQTTTP